MKKIVITANDNRGLDGEMGTHFGRSPFYVVARVTERGEVAATEVRKNPYTGQHGAGEVPRFIDSLGAEVVIAAGMGHKAIGWFKRLGIEVATGSRGHVGATLQAYLTGEMQGASGCAHGHGGSPGGGAEESLRE